MYFPNFYNIFFLAAIMQSAMEAEYRLEFFRENGFVRKRCPICGEHFWTKNAEQERCGDTPCVEYSFIGNPPVRRKYTVDEMRSAFLRFFERHGHTIIDRYPVLARWREDVFLVNASIYDFQPHVTSGLVDPPANPLVISQPSIRLTDLDSVGRTGKHLSSFEMLGHHAFNTEDDEIYWKEETVALCHEFLTEELGMDEETITYKEHPWAGGGNAGPSLEVLVGGLELATLVFMSMQESENGDFEFNGRRYAPMPIRVVDTGYGLERLAWISQGTPTIYETVFPDFLPWIFEKMGIEHRLDDEKYRAVLEAHSIMGGLMDIGSGKRIEEERMKIVRAMNSRGIDVTLEEYREIIEPLEIAYALADHSKTIALLLTDGAVPSNVKAGYLLRLLIRRALRMLEEAGMDIQLYELVIRQRHAFEGIMGDMPDSYIRDVLEVESEKYAETQKKGESIIKNLMKKGIREMEVERLIDLYDSQGLHPHTVKRIGEKYGIKVQIPDNFSSLVAERHQEERRAKKKDEKRYELPKTYPLYYDDEHAVEFDARVIYSDGSEVVLDRTLFYPEGGGQPADHGILEYDGKQYRVKDVQKYDGVIVHIMDGDAPPKGAKVHGKIDRERRYSLMRHHTATHIVVAAARELLGKHIWQWGAQKYVDSARVDITHYKSLKDEDLRRIERRANEILLEGKRVTKEVLPRNDAEKRYGFQLYQGGVPFTKTIRVVQVEGVDIEACAGTHVDNTLEIGSIKIIRRESVQDGVERLVYSAGIHAIDRVQEMEKLLKESAEVFSVLPKDLPGVSKKFFEEWKEYRKKVEHLSKYAAMAELMEIEKNSLEIGGVKAALHLTDKSREEMKALSMEIADKEGMIGILVGNDGTVMISRGKEVDIDCGRLMKESADKVGGKGGGRPDFAQGRIPADRRQEYIKTAEEMLKEII